MTKCLFYMAPIALIGLMAQALAAPTAWNGSVGRNIAAATAEARDASLVLERGSGCFRGGGGGGRGGGGGGGGGYRGGGGRAGAPGPVSPVATVGTSPGLPELRALTAPAG
jgi:uncharacterized membrane protein YgcG